MSWLLLVLLNACAQAEGSQSIDGALHDGTVRDAAADTSRADVAPMGVDAGGDAVAPTPTPPTPPPPPPDASVPGDAGRLDPGLALPDPGGMTCAMPGSLVECAGTAEVCRLYSPSEGRCESCVSCGNLDAPCAASNECDILFMCFLGRCTNFCHLGTFECGRVEDCLDVGHPTMGVCLIR